MKLCTAISLVHVIKLNIAGYVSCIIILYRVEIMTFSSMEAWKGQEEEITYTSYFKKQSAYHPKSCEDKVYSEQLYPFDCVYYM